MTVVTKTVKSSGGDYTSLSAAVVGMQGNLVANDQQLNIVCYAMNDTVNVAVSGYTTDVTHYIKITTDSTARHAGVWDGSKYNLNPPNLTALTMSVSNYMIDGLQISVNSSVDFRYGIRPDNNAVTIAYISNNIFKCNASQTGQYACGINSVTAAAGSHFYISNNLIYDFKATNAYGALRLGTASITAHVYNNTILNSANGIFQASSASVVAKNNIINGCTTSATGTFSAGTDYNATDKSSMGYTVTGGGNTHDRLSQTFTFVNAGSSDYHLQSSDAGAKGYGVDLHADANLPFTTDIDGQARSAPWDIGADQYVASGPLYFPMPPALYS